MSKPSKYYFTIWMIRRARRSLQTRLASPKSLASLESRNSTRVSSQLPSRHSSKRMIQACLNVFCSSLNQTANMMIWYLTCWWHARLWRTKKSTTRSSLPTPKEMIGILRNWKGWFRSQTKPTILNVVSAASAINSTSQRNCCLKSALTTRSSPRRTLNLKSTRTRLMPQRKWTYPRSGKRYASRACVRKNLEWHHSVRSLS